MVDYRSQRNRAGRCRSATTASACRRTVPASSPGLGTGIVEALAKQLGAIVSITDSAPELGCRSFMGNFGPPESDDPTNIFLSLL